MELTLGRISIAFRLLPARQRAMAWRTHRDGPVGESGLMRLIRLRRDRRHVAELEPRLLQDVGIGPPRRDDDMAHRRLDLVLWAGLRG